MRRSRKRKLGIERVSEKEDDSDRKVRRTRNEETSINIRKTSGKEKKKERRERVESE